MQRRLPASLRRNFGNRTAMSLPFARPEGLRPGFSMSRCRPDDAPGMTDVYMSAFKDTEHTYWWAPLPAMRQWNEERIRRRFADPSAQQFKVTDDQTGRVVAWAKWDLPRGRMMAMREGFEVYGEDGEPVRVSESNEHTKDGRGESGQASDKSYAQGPPDGCDVELFNEFFDGLVKLEKTWAASEKLVLTHLCTHADFHGRGIGSALLQSVLELADADGLSTYLESLRLATRLYERHDFVPVDRIEFARDGTGETETASIDIMLREPRVTPAGKV
ncbi:acyl-CoA N-acyltransferase [Xylariaceae sp. FL1019]|nr:acyl-CoA N-acyltransferase [Xylariaceae sp. FL1019]